MYICKFIIRFEILKGIFMKKIVHQLLLATALLSLCDQSNAMKRDKPDSAAEENESKKARFDTNQTEQSPLSDEIFDATFIDKLNSPQGDIFQDDNATFQTEQPTTAETPSEEAPSSQPMDTDSDDTDDDTYDESLDRQIWDATANNDTQMVKELLEKGTNPNVVKDDFSLLINAVMNENPAMVEMLLVEGANVNHADEGSIITPLIEAASLSSLEIVQMLIQYNADLNAQSDEGYTPLIRAIRDQQPQNAQALIDAGANVNLANNQGETPLIHAIANGDIALVRTLINAGANVNQADNKGETPLIHAIENGDVALVRTLIDAGANVNQADNQDITPLMKAAQNGNIEILQLLLDNDADVTAVDNKGCMALDWAEYACTQGTNTDAVKAALAAKNQEILDAVAGKWQACPLDLINGPINEFLFGQE
jgi:ankyrin repeat protein